MLLTVGRIVSICGLVCGMACLLTTYCQILLIVTLVLMLGGSLMMLIGAAIN